MTDILSITILLMGAFFFLAGTAGLLRFPDTPGRLHALTKADNLGLGLICLGLAIHDGSLQGILLLVFIWLLAMFSATLSAFLIARWHETRRSEAEHD
ncbi:monovalent cation/H(+) antiporter subunit G [Gammaproteobacteria bacterium AB-CW1]|uniref:Monovalent cation/H(+) antiporter subunit G n=1 Tax=Natronospira elongata TaxID=3110268 RepID=A0AAP6JG50_9GAMM|nr:monovalent cation/H(+) antiporter subunit G [Gammaproteobacteria bacterium AB-CW1]